MQFFYCLILSLLGIAHGSPYYYREDKHHSEHHKEYSYSDSHPSSSAYESSPQKYIQSSHFSTHVAPERYYKLETNPSLSSGFSQYSGGGQSAFHQSEFQTGGIQSGHITPLLAGQSINLEGVKPGTYVIKQVKVYRQPTTYTGFYGSSHLDGRDLETGQQEENLYGSQQEENLNAQTGQFVKQVRTSLYHQVPQAVPTITQDESLFGQKQISEEDFSQFGQQQVSGQKEDCTYNEHIEDLGQQPQRGDLDIGQEQDLSTSHSQIDKTLIKTPIDKNKGYKFYEKRVITYGTPEKESNAYKQTYVKHTQMHGTTNTEGKDFGKYQDILFGPTTVKTTNGFENIHTGSREETKHVRYNQEATEMEKKVHPIKPPTYYSNPVFIPQSNPVGQQSYSGSLEEGQHEERQYEQHSQDLGQQLVSGSLEVGQEPDSITGQQLETGSYEIGQNEESLHGKHLHTWERHINTSRVEVNGVRKDPSQKPFEHHLETERLEIGRSSNNKPHILVKENITRTVIVGHNVPTKPIQNLHEGQIEEAVSGQNIQTGFFELGQKEENVGQLETSNLEIGQHEENVGQLETGDLGIGQKEEDVGQLETGNLGIGQHEENVGQLETSELGIGQHEEQEVMPGKDKFKQSQKEDTSYDFELGKSTFPVKLKVISTKAPEHNEQTSYVKTYNQHESHYKEVKQTSNSKLKDLPIYYQKYDSTTTPRSTEQESINTKQKTNYLKLQQKAEELALQLGLEDISKQKSSQQDSYEDKYVKKNIGKTSEVHATEIQEHLIANHQALEKGSLVSNPKRTTWETRKEEFGLNYPLTSQGSYSKKPTNHHYENQDYFNQPISQNYGYQGQSQHSSHYGGYRQGYSVSGGEKAYSSDQPIQRTHTSGTQFLFSSSSGGSQDKQKVIDDFLKELDKDIAITNHQQRQQQGSYAGVTQSRPLNSGVSYYSQRTVSSHSNSSYSSSGTVPGETTGRAWYQRIGDSIGSSYNQAKEKAKDIVKTVKQSVSYSSS